MNSKKITRTPRAQRGGHTRFRHHPFVLRSTAPDWPPASARVVKIVASTVISMMTFTLESEGGGGKGSCRCEGRTSFFRQIRDDSCLSVPSFMLFFGLPVPRSLFLTDPLFMRCLRSGCLSCPPSTNHIKVFNEEYFPQCLKSLDCVTAGLHVIHYLRQVASELT